MRKETSIRYGLSGITNDQIMSPQKQQEMIDRLIEGSPLRNAMKLFEAGRQFEREHGKDL